jgi:acyl-CoA synthetase (NDP forming)/RimJ/RimL family protein N-acetyltransferase
VPPAASDPVTAVRAADAVLVDGATIGVRPVRADDEPALAALLEGLLVRSRWLRFFSGATDVRAAARQAASGPGVGGVVAVAGESGDLVGHALYVRDGAHRAEVAFEVADAWQGRGVGTILLGAAAERAAAEGIETFTAVVLPENHAMIDVFRESGFPVEVQARPGELSVELPTAVGPEAVRRFAERERIGAVAAVRHFVTPASVAVIGASARPGSIGAALLANVRESFDGPVFAIGRGQSVLDIADPVELAVVAVPANGVEAVARECAAKGVAALLVVSAGFEDAEGRRRRERLAAYCRSAGMRMIGPNCLGVAGPRLNATFARSPVDTGRVALISQSGGVGIAALEQGRAHGVGLSGFFSIGDRADISSNDVLQWCEDDDATDVIALYLEAFGNPRRFARVARRVTRTKPIVAVKAGHSGAGSRAAGSHTGALVAASDAAVDALFAQAGVIRTDSYRELLDVAGLLAAQPAPAGPRLGVVTNGGGPAILLADAAEVAGLELPAPGAAAARALRGILPDAAAPANPVDVLGDATKERLRDAVAVLAADTGLDALAVVYVPTLVLDPQDAADAIVEGVAAAGSQIPVVAVLLTGQEPPAALRDAGIPVHGFPEDAARALGAAARYGATRARMPSPPAEVRPAPRRDEAAAVIARALASGAEWLAPGAVEQLADCYGLPLAAGRVVRTPAQAADAAAELGGAVALKAVALGLVHKTDAGAVRLALRGRTAVLRAAREMKQSLHAAGHTLTGFHVQRMAPPGAELLVGLTTDPQFGPVIACAAGGTAVELLADSAIRLAPLSERDVHEMPRSLATFPLLTGHRGAPRADVDALEDVLRRVSALADDLPAIAELDCNPVRVSPRGATIVDMRVHVRAAPAAAPIGSLQGP